MDDLHAHGRDGGGRLVDARSREFPERTAFVGGDEDGDEMFPALGQEGGEHVGLISEFLDGLHDFRVAFLGHFAAVVQDAVHRAFG